MRVEIRWSSRKLENEFYSLAKSNPQRFKDVKRGLDKLLYDPFSGTFIPKRLIPKKWQSKLNIWKYNLARGWRLFYTVEIQERNEYCITIIVDFMSHKKYERLFKY